MTQPKTLNNSQLTRLTTASKANLPFLRLLEKLSSPEKDSFGVAGLNGSSSSFLVSSLAAETARPLLVITDNSIKANDYFDDLSSLLGPDKVGHFPARQILPYDFRAPVGEIMGRRISTLNGLTQNNFSVVVCSIRAIIEPTISKNELTRNSINLKCGEES